MRLKLTLQTPGPAIRAARIGIPPLTDPKRPPPTTPPKRGP
jgi:hypothetical protein